MSYQEVCAISPRTAAIRDRFLEAAGQVFLHAGFEKACMQDIVKISGGSLSTLYKLFGNKEQLFEAVLEKGTTDFFGPLEHDLEKMSNEAVRPFLKHFSLHFLAMIMDENSLAFHRLMVLEGPKNDGHIGKLFYQYAVTRVNKIMLKVLKRNYPDFPEEDLNYAAYQFVAMIKEPYYHRAQVIGEKCPLSSAEMERFLDRTIERFLCPFEIR